MLFPMYYKENIKKCTVIVLLFLIKPFYWEKLFYKDSVWLKRCNIEVELKSLNSWKQIHDFVVKFIYKQWLIS